MIEAAKRVIRGVAGRIVPGADSRTSVTRGVQRRVHRRHRGRRNRDDAGPVLLRALDVAEPEGAISHEWSAERQAILVLVERILARGQRILRVERVVAEEFVDASRAAVRARLRDDADRAARGAAE